MLKCLGISYVHARQWFHIAKLAIWKSLYPVLVVIRGTKDLFEFVERSHFELFGRTSKLGNVDLL